MNSISVVHALPTNSSSHFFGSHGVREICVLLFFALCTLQRFGIRFFFRFTNPNCSKRKRLRVWLWCSSAHRETMASQRRSHIWPVLISLKYEIKSSDKTKKKCVACSRLRLCVFKTEYRKLRAI